MRVLEIRDELGEWHIVEVCHNRQHGKRMAAELARPLDSWLAPHRNWRAKGLRITMSGFGIAKDDLRFTSVDHDEGMKRGWPPDGSRDGRGTWLQKA